MRLADRLFAFWRLPTWTDSVQVLLWLMGWGVVATSGLLAVMLVPMVVRGAAWAFSADWGLVFGAVGAIAMLMIAGWFVVGCWFVSEAYRSWRDGHPHGRQWALVIAGLLLLNSVPVFFMDGAPGTGHLAVRAISAALAVALIVACFTTKPPQPGPATAV